MNGEWVPAELATGNIIQGFSWGHQRLSPVSDFPRKSGAGLDFSALVAQHPVGLKMHISNHEGRASTLSISLIFSLAGRLDRVCL